MEMTVMRKEEIKWHHRLFTTIMDTSFESSPIHEDHPLGSYEYFKQYIPDESFDLIADKCLCHAKWLTMF